MAAAAAVRSVVDDEPGWSRAKHQEATTAMHPAIMYEVARSKIDDEQRAADRRRLARIAAEARPPRTGGTSIVERVWALLSGTAPARPALTGESR